MPAADYRFKHFNIRIMLGDMKFGNTALFPGQTIPNTNLTHLDSTPVKLYDLLTNKKALLIVTGSLTCPMTISSLSALNKLEEEFGKEILFRLLYVREAHPGKTYPQPQSLSQKISHANDLIHRYEPNFSVLIDDLDGTLHNLLDCKPNSVHLINNQGVILFQTLWAGDNKSLKNALNQVNNTSEITQTISQKIMLPFIRSAGYMDEILNLAGAGAYKELLIGAPPVALLSKTASFFTFLPRSIRGYAVGFLFVITVLLISDLTFS